MEHIYTLWYANRVHFQHIQECIYYESTIYVICILSNSSGTEILDLNLSFACLKAQTVSFNPPKNLVLPGPSFDHIWQL